MPKRRRRSRRRRRGGENSLQQIEHGADDFTNTIMKEPDKFVGAISGELTKKETRRSKVKRKAKEYGTRVMGFLKKFKFWGGRRRTRRGRRRRRRRTRRCHHRRGRRHTKRCRRRRSRRRRRRRR